MPDIQRYLAHCVLAEVNCISFPPEIVFYVPLMSHFLPMLTYQLPLCSRMLKISNEDYPSFEIVYGSPTQMHFLFGLYYWISHIKKNIQFTGHFPALISNCVSGCLRTSGDHLVQPPAQGRTNPQFLPQLPKWPPQGLNSQPWV
uniref:Uncharacterized protein n=1 Tax=Chelydra serpentina TaxID=8475 RepID=A0A8C3XPQ6_CHESE